MKKSFSLVVILLISSVTYSQVEVGIFAGPQATTASYTVTKKKQKTEYKYGFNAGVTLKVPFDKNLFFAPAIFYSMKGYKVALTHFTYPPDTLAKDNDTRIHTLELAALLQYDLGKDPGHAFIKVGPTLDFNLSGKETFTLTNGNSVTRNMPFDFTGHYGPIAANFLFQLGYETGSGIFFFGQYSHGLASINNEDKGPGIKHRVFAVSIGKYLNRKKIVIDTKNKE
jgi:hypothetical protein